MSSPTVGSSFQTISKWTVLIISCLSSNYHPLKAQCLENYLKIKATTKVVQDDKRDKSAQEDPLYSLPYEKLETVSSLARFVHNFAVSVYTLSTLKNLLVILVNMDYFVEYLHIDCFLVGRLRQVGRVTFLGPWFNLIFCIIFLTIRLGSIRFGREYKFHMLEFILYDRNYLVEMDGKYRLHQSRQNEVLRSIRRQQSSLKLFSSRGYQALSSSIGASFLRPNVRKSDLVKFGSRPNSAEKDFTLDPVLYISNQLQFVDDRPSMSMNNKECVPKIDWIRRPNRGVASWDQMQLTTVSFAIIGALFVTNALVLVPLIFGGAIMTNLGFEMAYPGCCKHLKRVQAGQDLSSGQFLSWIYIPSRSNIYDKFDARHHLNRSTKLASEMHIDDLPPFIPLTMEMQINSWFFWVRILFDFFEQYFWVIDFQLMFVCQTYIIYAISLDVMQNVRSIESDLRNLIVKLEIIRGRRTSSSFSPREVFQLLDSRSLEPGYLDSGESDEFKNPLILEVIRIQTILSDHFDKIKNYSNYISFYIIIILSMFFASLFLISFWISRIRSLQVEQEFIIMQISGCVYLIILTAGMAMTRSVNLELYPLIANVMALDPSISFTKMRWTSIMKYYYPEPMYCFTLLRTSEISWLFILKVCAWIVSANLVFANLHYMSSMKTVDK